MSSASFQSGRFTAAVKDAVLGPRVAQVTTPVLYLHAASATAAQAMGVELTFLPSVERITSRVADAGFTVCAPTAQDLWGNGSVAAEAGTSMRRAQDALAYCRSARGQSQKPPIVIAASMGTVAALRYASLFPVSCVVGLLAIADLTNAYVNDLGSNRANIAVAWGVTYPAALPAGADPYRDLMAGLSGVPMLLHYSSDDAFSTNVQNFADGTGAQLVSYGALGHTDAAVQSTDVQRVLDFVLAHG